jgi:hypothetical protein
VPRPKPPGFAVEFQVGQWVKVVSGKLAGKLGKIVRHRSASGLYVEIGGKRWSIRDYRLEKIDPPRSRQRAQPEHLEDEGDGEELRLYALLSLRLPAELALDLRRVAKARGKSVNAAVTEAIRQYIGSRP